MVTEGVFVPAWAVLGAVGALVVVLVVAVVAVGVTSSRRVRVASAEQALVLESMRLELEDLRRRVDAPTTPEPHEYVITRLGEPEDPEQAADRVPAVPGPLFADLVLRESVVHAVSLGAGVRRALSAESRHRIRFAMRREVKQARRQRRLDDRQARREWQARQRAAA